MDSLPDGTEVIKDALGKAIGLDLTNTAMGRDLAQRLAKVDEKENEIFESLKRLAPHMKDDFLRKLASNVIEQMAEDENYLTLFKN